MKKQNKPFGFIGLLNDLMTLIGRNDELMETLQESLGGEPNELENFIDNYDKNHIPTVNVIEQVNGEIIGITSFLDTPDGNKSAETLFKELYKEYNDPDGTTGFVQPTDEEFAAMMEDGIWEDTPETIGDSYAISITHSTQG